MMLKKTSLASKISSKRKRKKKKISHKKKNKHNKYLIFSIFATFLAFVIVGAILSYQFIFKNLPSPRNLSRQRFDVSTKIYDRNQSLLYEIYNNQNRTPVKLNQLPKYVMQATVAIEDRNFYHHGGFSLEGIFRAFYKNVSQNQTQGGSTITQQLIKTALLSPERTIKRKLREVILAIITETMYSKDQILEMYLNYIPYGGTAYGIEQAAQLYFNIPAKNLSLAQAALLAGLPQAPTLYSPFRSSPQLAKRRQEQVLQRMLEDHYINKQQFNDAVAEQLHFAPQRTDIKAPHFVMYVKDLLIKKYGRKLVEQGGLRVTTTLDLPLQEYAQASVAAEIAKVKKFKVTNGAALVTRPNTGEILAMIGSRNYYDKEIDGNVNLTTSLRQPGSSIKPLNYALGIANGFPASKVFLDIPTCFTAPGQPGAYCPKNYDGNFHGPVQMRYALANSYNIPAVKMLALNGIKNFIATASAMGITTWKDPSRYGLSLTLGGGEVYMTDMATAFGVFANSGIRIDLNPILKIEDYKGKVLEEHDLKNHPPAGKRILSSDVTFIISNILADNNARIPAFGARSDLYIPGKTVSVKTGTTDDLKDNWTIGYTPEFLTAVWVGNNDSSPMNPYVVSGVTGASPIWHAIMSHLVENRKDIIPPRPENVIGSNVCLIKAPTDDQNPQKCEGRYEYFIKGTEKDPIHATYERKNTWIDKETQRPPLPGKTDNLELQEKTMVSDEFTKEYCLDCPHENEPPYTVNVQEVWDKLHPKKPNTLIK